MRITTIISLILLLSAASQAQQVIPDWKIKFEYDAAGNRIVRRPVDLNQEVSDPGQVHFTAQPNPTDGDITIDIGGGITTVSSLTLQDMTGTVLYEYEGIQPASNHLISLAAFAPGMYIVRVVNEQYNEALQIIKQ